MSEQTPWRLDPLARVTDRRDGRLQVGLHPAARVLLPATSAMRALLSALVAGSVVTADGTLEGALEGTLAGAPEATAAGPSADPATAARRLGALAELRDAGFLIPVDRIAEQAAGRAELPVGLWADAGWEPRARELITAAGLCLGDRRDAQVWLVAGDGETRRPVVEELIREDLPHLLLAGVAGRARLGPFVVPGRTACLYCVDAHQADRDPAHILVTLAHTGPGRAAELPAPLRDLALAWAVGDLVSYVDGRQPSTWSTRIDVGPELRPEPTRYLRHPRCGCAWAELAG